jgi:hypothetical protein
MNVLQNIKDTLDSKRHVGSNASSFHLLTNQVDFSLDTIYVIKIQCIDNFQIVQIFKYLSLRSVSSLNNPENREIIFLSKYVVENHYS